MAKDKKFKDEEFEPKGTMVIVLIFLITLIVLWGSLYVTLINRGATI